MHVTAHAVKATLKHIQSLRGLFLHESSIQIRYDACHARGWTDSWLLTIDGVAVGYGAIRGQQPEGRDTIFEFYVIPPFRMHSRLLFTELVASSGVTHVECQSNDASLAPMLYQFTRDIASDVVLFDDHQVTRHEIAGAVVRLRRDGDRIFEHAVEPIGGYVLEIGAEIVASGGFMLHYNVPFADLFMEVRSDSRRRGFGSFLIQEVKQACYVAGRVPAARCRLRNMASRATLLKAGMRVCGSMLIGTVNDDLRKRTASTDG
jgi:GNAT superfamily N-acetyltransferase